MMMSEPVRAGKLYDKISAFGFTINDKILGFQLFHVSTSFQLQAFSFLHPKFFGFWLLAFGFRLAFRLCVFFNQKLSKIGKSRKLKKIKAFGFPLPSSKLFFSFLLSAVYTLNSLVFGFRLLALGFWLVLQLRSRFL